MDYIKLSSLVGVKFFISSLFGEMTSMFVISGVVPVSFSLQALMLVTASQVTLLS